MLWNNSKISFQECITYSADILTILLFKQADDSIF